MRAHGGWIGRSARSLSEVGDISTTPSRDEAADTRYARQFLESRPEQVLKSGGAPEFLRVLREQVIPFVDAQLRTTPDRGLVGHSLGGLFALYTLFEQPELFTRHAICRPSLWWNQRQPFAREAAYAAGHKSLPARVFMSVGADEGGDLFETFVATIRGRGYQQLQLTSHIFEGETHASVVPAACREACESCTRSRRSSRRQHCSNQLTVI